MNNTIVQLAERRIVLVAKIETQRLALTTAIIPLRSPLRLADKGVQAVRYFVTHPVLIAGVMMFAIATRPKRWLFLLEKGWMVWRLAQAAKRRLANST